MYIFHGTLTKIFFFKIAEIQQKQQKTKRQQSLTSSDNFSSSRSDSIKHGHCMPLR